MKTTHILETDFGIKCTLEIDEDTGMFRCVWDGTPAIGKWPKKFFKRVMNIYLPWRNDLLNAWCKRSGKRMMLINL
jgi:hypothetical protein